MLVRPDLSLYCWHGVMRNLRQPSKRAVYVSRGLKKANEVISRGQDTIKTIFTRSPDTHEDVSRGLGTKTLISRGQFLKMAFSRGRVKDAWQPFTVKKSPELLCERQFRLTVGPSVDELGQWPPEE